MISKANFVLHLSWTGLQIMTMEYAIGGICGHYDIFTCITIFSTKMLHEAKSRRYGVGLVVTKLWGLL